MIFYIILRYDIKISITSLICYLNYVLVSLSDVQRVYIYIWDQFRKQKCFGHEAHVFTRTAISSQPVRHILFPLHLVPFDLFRKFARGLGFAGGDENRQGGRGKRDGRDGRGGQRTTTTDDGDGRARRTDETGGRTTNDDGRRRPK